jgi:hypothetical protein
MALNYSIWRQRSCGTSYGLGVHKCLYVYEWPPRVQLLELIHANSYPEAQRTESEGLRDMLICDGVSYFSSDLV